MWGKSDKPRPKRKLLDKILMGLVIGGAVGSVIGASIYKKRKADKEKEEEIMAPAKEGKRRRIVNALKKRMFKKWREEDKDKVIELPNEMEIK